jgi:hypothetical protein
MSRLLDSLSDEDLGREIWALWHAYYIQKLPFTINGASVSRITNKQLKQILPGFRVIVRVATFDQDTNDESLAGLEKGLRRCSSGDFAGGGRLFRAHFERRIEAKTGRRRQSAIASLPRPDYLQTVLMELVRANFSITKQAAIEELKRREGPPGEEPRIDRVDEREDEVWWIEPGKPEKSAPLSGLKHRLRNARRAVREEASSF